MKVDILAFGAHPDDIELGCGGTLIKEIESGKKVGLIDLTKGELGTRGTPEIRQQEAQKALELMGAIFRKQMGFADGFFEVNQQHKMTLIKVIRTHRPDTVLCNALDDRHIDHARGAKLVADACFLSGLSKINTNQEAWRPKNIFHYIQWKNLTPNLLLDISGFMAKKMALIKAYQSQFYNPKSNEPITPITSKNFFESISYRAKDLGRLINVDYAEGFNTQNVVALNSISDLI